MEILKQNTLNFHHRNKANREHNYYNRQHQHLSQLSTQDAPQSVSHGIGAEAALAANTLKFIAAGLGAMTIGVVMSMRSAYRKATSFALQKVSKMDPAKATQVAQDFKDLGWNTKAPQIAAKITAATKV